MDRWRTRRTRFWIEAALAAASAALLIVTLLVPDWIEEVFKIDPDEGSGALEWAIVGLFAAATIAASVLARLEWRRPLPFAPPPEAR
jgi:hypothetical protein